MRSLFTPHAVGVPGLAALLVGGALFFVFLLRAGLSGKEESGARSGLSRAGILVQMLGFVAVGLGPLDVALAPASSPALLAAAAVAALMAGAVLLFVAATRAMGANWSLAARMREDHALVTRSVFARLRHPIYAAMALYLLALAIAFGHYAGLVPGAPLFPLGTALRVREEERLLRARFGAAYEAYAASVKRFVPGLA